MPISEAGGVTQVGIRITPEGVVETTHGLKLTVEQVRELGNGLVKAASDGKVFSVATQQASKESENFVRALREEAATLGMTQIELKTYQLSQMALSATQREAANEAIERIRRHEEERASVERLTATAISWGKAAAVAAGAVAAGFVYQVRRSIDAAAGMQTLSEKTGIAVEQLSRLKYAADLSDTSIETVARALAMLPKALVEAKNPNSPAGRAFDFLGIDPAQLKTQQQAIDAIADAITRVQDPMAKSAALQMIFKRSGEELIPLFNAGSDGLRKMGDEGARWAEISGMNAQRSKELKDQLVTLEYASSALAKTVGSTLVPQLNKLIELYLEAKKGGDLKQLALGGPLSNAGEQIAVVSRKLDELRQTKATLEADTLSARLNRATSPEDLAIIDTQISSLESRKRLLQVAQRQEVLEKYGSGAEDQTSRRFLRKDITGSPEGRGTGSDGKSEAERLHERFQESVLKFREQAARAADDIEDTPEVKRYYEAIARITRGDLKGGSVAEKQQYALAATDQLQAEQVAAKRRKDAKDAAARAEELRRLEERRVRLQEQSDAHETRRHADLERTAANEENAVERARAANEQIGLTAAGLRELNIRRADQAVATLEAARAESVAADEGERELAIIDRRIQAAKDYASALRQGQEKHTAVDEEAARQKAVEKEMEEDRRRAQGIERSLTDALMRGFENGKGFGRNFLDVLKNMARTTILEPMVKPIVQPLAEAGSQVAKGLGGWLRNLLHDPGQPDLSAGAGEYGGGWSEAVKIGTGHAGAVAGVEFTGSKTVPQSVFYGARRMHSGGLAGDEVPAVLKKGEGVFTPAQMRALGPSGAATTVHAPLQVTIDARGADAGVETRIRQVMREEMPGMLYEQRRVVAGVVSEQQRTRGVRL